MQDFHDYSMTGGSGDWRMRVQPNNNNHLKCPRCNSLNTKFCYYNNYNHSQPRHFCKNCRRYWTKGGVLRNVPVGGGCRKAKRTSKSKHQPKDGEEKPSSSESSSHTAAVTATATAAAAANADMHDLKWSTFLGQSSSDGGDFSELGGFTSIETTPFGFGNTVHQQFEDRTAEIDPSMGFEPLDWGSGGGDQTLFDLTSTVDHAYWSHQDHNDLYLPQF